MLSIENVALKIRYTGGDLMQNKQFHEAIDVYTKALNIVPSNNWIVVTLLHGRAYANSNIGNFREAIEDCTKALAIDASCVNIRLLRAQCHHYLEEFEASINDYELVEAAAQLQQDTAKLSEVRLKFANVKTEMNRKRAELKNTNGNEQLNVHNYQLAEKYYSEAIELWPNNLVFYGNRCNCLIKQGQLERALQDCHQLIRIDQNYGMSYELQAKCHLISGEYDSAEQAIKRLEKINLQSSKHLHDLSTKLRKLEKLATQHFDDKKFLSAGNEYVKPFEMRN